MDQLRVPDAVLQRIVKAKLPESVHLAKDARLALHEAAVVFVSYLTTAASDLGKAKNVKTVSAALVIQALQELELDALIPAVNETLAQLKATKRKSSGGSKGGAKGKDKGAAPVDAEAEAEDAEEEEAAGEEEDEDEDEEDDAMESSSAAIADAPDEL